VNQSFAHTILDTAQDAFISMDVDGRITFWNRRAVAMFGYSRDEAVGHPLAEMIIPPIYREAHTRGLRRFLETGIGPVLGQRIELKAIRRDGTKFPVELTISAVDETDRWSFHAFVQDISERVQAAADREELLAQVEALARTDPLTGLPNRRAWDEELRREMARAERSGHPFTVALLDLDHFKVYNDTHGHPAGDSLLHDVGIVWRTALRVTDFVARFGGEEFAALLPDSSPAVARLILGRLCSVMPPDQTFSAGIATWVPLDSVESLIQRTDEALYEAKAAGRNRFVEASPPS